MSKTLAATVREELGLTYRELAYLVGVTPHTVQKWTAKQPASPSRAANKVLIGIYSRFAQSGRVLHMSVHQTRAEVLAVIQGPHGAEICGEMGFMSCESMGRIGCIITDNPAAWSEADRVACDIIKRAPGWLDGK